MVQQQATSGRSRLAASSRRLGRASGGHGRVAAQGAGLVLVAAGMVTAELAWLVPAAFLLGWSVSPDPDHAYLEGFTDGTIAVDMEATRDAAGHRGDVPGLPGDAGEDVVSRAPRPLVRGLGEAGGTEQVGSWARPDLLRSPAGYPGSPFDADGAPAIRPRSTDTIPAAELTGTAGLERFAARAAARSEAGPGIGSLPSPEE